METSPHHALSDVMMRCHVNKNYQACIVFENELVLKDMVMAFKELREKEKKDDTWSIVIWQTSHCRAKIKFPNDSAIAIYHESDPELYKHRYNDLLYEDSMSDEYVDLKIAPLLVRYVAVSGSPIMARFSAPTPKDEELTEFLDSFKILKENS